MAKFINVEAELQVEQALNAIEIGDAIEHYGEDNVLEEIGVDKAKKYFGLIEKLEEE